MRRAVVLAAVAVLAAACASSTPVIVKGSAPPIPYSGPLYLPMGNGDATLTGGAAGRALECDHAQYTGGRPDYQDGLLDVGSSYGRALANFLREGGLPSSGYRLEREDGSRVLISWDVAGRTKIAFVLKEGVRDYRHRLGWGVEAFASCDPAEFPPAVAAALGFGVWRDRHDKPVPITIVQSFPHVAFCSYRGTDSLRVGSGAAARTYVRDPAHVLTHYLTTRFEEHATRPADAVDSGYHRDGRELWFAADRAVAYLVSVASPADVEAWPAARPDVACG
jgi:hypothetical protein